MTDAEQTQVACFDDKTWCLVKHVFLVYEGRKANAVFCICTKAI